MKTKVKFIFHTQPTKIPDDIFDYGQVEINKGDFKIINSYKLL